MSRLKVKVAGAEKAIGYFDTIASGVSAAIERETDAGAREIQARAKVLR
ncbi:hypothetical protein SCACP_36780 [Sporomusa carbonis]